MAILSSESFDDINRETIKKKGPLIKVQLREGQFVKMYQADAIKLGLIPAPAKSLPPQEDKIKKPEEDKSDQARKGQSAGEAGDDLTEVSGIGKATARLLASKGIQTLDDLRSADLDALDLTERTRQAIEAWKESEGLE